MHLVSIEAQGVSDRPIGDVSCNDLINGLSNPDFNPTEIKGYRDGDDWYDGEGNKIDNPMVLQTATGISPFLKSNTFNLENSFKDYAPQISLLPNARLNVKPYKFIR